MMDYVAVANEAQRARIKTWLRINYVGGRKSVGHWNDHYFFLSRFSASESAKVAGVTADSARRRMDRLAKEGVLERFKESYGPVSYRLPRESCDRMAEEVTKELLAEGLGMDRVG